MKRAPHPRETSHGRRIQASRVRATRPQGVPYVLRRDFNDGDTRSVPATRKNRRGLSLFEVLIALAIFMGALAAIGQLIATGARGAVFAKLQTQAVIRCE